MLFEDVFPAPLEVIAGVKAVYGPMLGHFLCFGGDSAAAAARNALTRPWVICIAANNAHDRGNVGRVLNIVQLNSLHGPTTAFAADDDERQRYARWPTAVGCDNIYEVVDRPHVIADLGMADNPNYQLHDKVGAFTAKRMPLLAAMKGQRLKLADLPPLPHFIDPGKLQPVGSRLPSKVSALEGKAILAKCRAFERDSSLAKDKKAANRLVNGGVHVCEGCGFSHPSTALVDAHHRRPLFFHGRTETTLCDLQVLCPICHRLVHHLALMPHEPIDLDQLQAWWASKR